ncbi:MAG: VCBS repeat-containing protein [Chthoniobacterales bacterium]
MSVHFFETLRRCQGPRLVFPLVLAFSSVVAHAAALEPAAKAPFRGQPNLTLPAVSEATGLNVADLNGDGSPDIVLLSGETASVSILLAQAGSEFTVSKPIEVPAGASASGLALGDLNEDGKIDIAVSHHDTDEIWIFFGQGDGTFAAPDKVRVPVTKAHCHAIVAADFNRDRHLDLVLAESSDNCVWVLLGDGKGKFVRAPDSPISTDRHPYVVAVADLDGDQNPDIVTPNWFGKSVGVLLGDGKGRFHAAPASPFHGPKDPTALAAGDLTGDGNPDLVVGNNGSRGLQLFIGDGKGSFRAGAELKPAEACYGPTIADLNGDGKLDVISTSTGDARTLSYWINRGGGEFSPAFSVPCPNGANTLCVADINSDQLPDLLVGPEERGPVLVWLGQK